MQTQPSTEQMRQRIPLPHVDHRWAPRSVHVRPRHERTVIHALSPPLKPATRLRLVSLALFAIMVALLGLVRLAF